MQVGFGETLTRVARAGSGRYRGSRETRRW